MPVPSPQHRHTPHFVAISIIQYPLNYLPTVFSVLSLSLSLQVKIQHFFLLTYREFNVYYFSIILIPLANLSFVWKMIGILTVLAIIQSRLINLLNSSNRHSLIKRIKQVKTRHLIKLPLDFDLFHLTYAIRQ